MSEIPSTVTDALAPIDVAGETCLEAGAGVGNMALALREAGARRVVAVTDDPAHATGVRDRVPGDRIDVVQADLRVMPVPDDAVSVVTAHALCNVLPPPALNEVVAELSRGAAPGARLIVIDYEPLPPGVVADVFGVENAVANLTDGSPAYSFYPPSLLTDLLNSRGWNRDSHRTLLDPVPWPRSLLAEHATLAREASADLPADLHGALDAYLDDCMDKVDDEVQAGRYYALVFTRA